jgi:hypothetical protein
MTPTGAANDAVERLRRKLTLSRRHRASGLGPVIDPGKTPFAKRVAAAPASLGNQVRASRTGAATVGNFPSPLGAFPDVFVLRNRDSRPALHTCVQVPTLSQETRLVGNRMRHAGCEESPTASAVALAIGHAEARQEPAPILLPGLSASRICIGGVARAAECERLAVETDLSGDGTAPEDLRPPRRNQRTLFCLAGCYVLATNLPDRVGMQIQVLGGSCSLGGQSLVGQPLVLLCPGALNACCCASLQ